MGMNFKRKSKKNYVQFTTRFEEDLMQKIRKTSEKTGLSINEVINQSVRYALDNADLN